MTATDGDRQRWTVHGPKGRDVSWEMRLDTSDERLRWRPVDSSALFEEWALEFESTPGDRGTRVRLRFDLPGGQPGRDALERAPEMYETFNDEEDGCIKITMMP